MQPLEARIEEIDQAKVKRLVTLLFEVNRISEGDNQLAFLSMQYFCHRNKDLNMNRAEGEELLSKLLGSIKRFFAQGRHVERQGNGQRIRPEKVELVTEQLVEWLGELMDGYYGYERVTFFTDLDILLKRREKYYSHDRKITGEGTLLERFQSGEMKFQTTELNKMLEEYVAFDPSKEFKSKLRARLFRLFLSEWERGPSFRRR